MFTKKIGNLWLDRQGSMVMNVIQQGTPLSGKLFTVTNNDLLKRMFGAPSILFCFAWLLLLLLLLNKI
jgi:hypothetical protein